MCVKLKIKNCLEIIKKSISQAPKDKAPLLESKLAKILEKYIRIEGDSQQEQLLKDLQFNLNFIRLSFPHLDYNLEIPPPAADEESKT
jgi:DNA-dependent RNA polymerase auxiliary subunit epsilon